MPLIHRLGGAALPTMLLALGIAPAQAQVSVELRAGGAIGNHTPAFAGLEAHPGPSLAAAVDVRVHPLLTTYATFVHASFGCEDGWCVGEDVTVRSSGFGAGLRLDAGGLPWARAGLLYYGTDVRTSTGEYPGDAAVGVDLGAGVSIPAFARTELLAGASLRTQPGSDDRTTLLSLELGARVAVLRPSR